MHRYNVQMKLQRERTSVIIFLAIKKKKKSASSLHFTTRCAFDVGTLNGKMIKLRISLNPAVCRGVAVRLVFEERTRVFLIKKMQQIFRDENSNEKKISTSIKKLNYAPNASK